MFQFHPLPIQRRSWLVCRAATPTRSEAVKPAWAGTDDWLSRAVNVLIGTPFIYAVLKRQAKAVLRRTAESRGIDWTGNVRALSSGGLQAYYAERTGVRYPEYYMRKFHAYDAGNLCWEAAYEAEPATYAMALRVWPHERELSWREAQRRLRYSFLEAVDAFHAAAATKNALRVAIDIGCSVGVSTRYLAEWMVQRAPDALSMRVYGVDLSPYFLAVARARQATGDIADASVDRRRASIEYVHAQAEALPFADDTADLITLQFVLHELPRSAARAIFPELVRVMRSGGTLAFVDNNPRSPVIQNLPPALFTLMKSTEPHSDDYYTFDVEAALRDTPGVVSVQVHETDPRHRTILCRVHKEADGRPPGV